MNSKKQYCRKVRSLLPCRSTDKKRIVTQLESSLDAYLAEHPTAGYADMVLRFGTPEDVAAAYVENCPAETMKAVDLKKKIVAAVVAALSLALILYCTALGFALVDAHRSYYGYGETYVGEVHLPEDFQWDN